MKQTEIVLSRSSVKLAGSGISEFHILMSTVRWTLEEYQSDAEILSSFMIVSIFYTCIWTEQIRLFVIMFFFDT